MAESLLIEPKLHATGLTPLQKDFFITFQLLGGTHDGRFYIPDIQLRHLGSIVPAGIGHIERNDELPVPGRFGLQPGVIERRIGESEPEREPLFHYFMFQLFFQITN